MNKQIIGISILSITAIMLLVANLMPQQAQGIVSVRDRDYQMVTTRMQQGGEGLYILDTRTGQIAVFTYNNASRSLEARAVRPVTDAFGGRR
jgi:hypothetical protein